MSKTSVYIFLFSLIVCETQAGVTFKSVSKDPIYFYSKVVETKGSNYVLAGPDFTLVVKDGPFRLYNASLLKNKLKKKGYNSYWVRQKDIVSFSKNIKKQTGSR